MDTTFWYSELEMNPYYIGGEFKYWFRNWWY